MARTYSFTVDAKLDRKSINQIKKQINELSGQTISLKSKIDPSGLRSMKSWVGSIKDAKKAVDGYNQSWFQMLKTATKYRIASLPFYAMTIAANEAKEAVIDFDKALTE